MDSCTATNFEPNFDLNIDLDLECSQDTGTTMSSNKRKRFKVATEEDFDQLLSKQGLRMPMTDRVTFMIPCYHFNCNSRNTVKKYFAALNCTTLHKINLDQSNTS